MNEFEMLKDLLEYGLRISRPYERDPTLRQIVVLSLRSDKLSTTLHYKVNEEDWEQNTPAVKYAVQALHREITSDKYKL